MRSDRQGGTWCDRRTGCTDRDARTLRDRTLRHRRSPAESSTAAHCSTPTPSNAGREQRRAARPRRRRLPWRRSWRNGRQPRPDRPRHRANCAGRSRRRLLDVCAARWRRRQVLGTEPSGELGQGDTVWRGDHPGEMGDNLPAIDLGTGRTAQAIASDGRSCSSPVCPGSGAHTCALLDDGSVKCWGDNTTGALGYGDTSNRGDQPGEMGDNLAPVDLGTGRTATAVSTGTVHTCALLDNRTVKCWGDNTGGQLGQGDTDTVATTPARWATTCPPSTSAPAGPPARSPPAGATRVRCSTTAPSSVGASNIGGQLGQGDTADRGDNPGEMGDNLSANRPRHRPHRHRDQLPARATRAPARRRHRKCWGDGARRSSAKATTDPRRPARRDGRQPPPIDLGTGRTAFAIAPGRSLHVRRTGQRHRENVGERIDSGELGQGDIETAW